MLDRSAAGAGVLGTLAAAVAAGVDRVQVRERAMEGRELLEYGDAVCDAARRAARVSGRALSVVVNRRVDVAIAAGADGVHLGFDGVDPGTARRLLGPDALVGVSCHAASEVREATEASYAHLAPIFPPLSKAATRPALGPESLREASRHRDVLAQGGVDAGNAAACIAAGAAGVAVTGAILMADDPAEATRALRRALDGAASRGCT